MAKKERILKELKVVGHPEVNTVRVTLGYEIGGMNYFVGRNERRGLYLSVSPLNVQKKEGYTTVSYRGFSGSKKLVKEMKRFSQKTLDTFQPSEDDIKYLISYVVDDNMLETYLEKPLEV